MKMLEVRWTDGTKVSVDYYDISFSWERWQHEFILIKDTEGKPIATYGHCWIISLRVEDIS
jgi:hypothetical protein